jgi:protein gp37
MQRTKIEWCDYTLNPVKGLCPMACSYCYARAMYKRFKWNPELRYEDVFWYPGIKGKPGDRYFVGSMMELFGSWIEKWWLENIFMWVEAYPQRTFIFLTKQPQNLIKWSPFPENCWVGVTVTDKTMLSKATDGLMNVQASVKFISFEPLLAPADFYPQRLTYVGINWVIIELQTPFSPKTAPYETRVEDIVQAADEAKIPVFLKNNLENLALRQDICYRNGKLRQEFPK